MIIVACSVSCVTSIITIIHYASCGSISCNQGDAVCARDLAVWVQSRTTLSLVSFVLRDTMKW